MLFPTSDPRQEFPRERTTPDARVIFQRLALSNHNIARNIQYPLKADVYFVSVMQRFRSPYQGYQVASCYNTQCFVYLTGEPSFFSPLRVEILSNCHSLIPL